MTKEEAIYIQCRFKVLPVWEGMKETHPKFVKAVEMLPDESGMDLVCHELRVSFEDAKKEAERLFKRL